ncbi:MAG: isoaspartyl peptidase/L-asparaginase [Ktedonobacteraceae bacterium]|nr:isoaspartyl peptidase/L-asparaginase [Ktedonobacteraceae bacterium]
MGIAIVVHGGVGAIPAKRLEMARAGCKEAAALGWSILKDGGSALDAVEAAVQALEDNPNYNAGTGSSLAADGSIQMDAGLMEGHTLRVGAVASVELIKNPITLARHVLESPHVLLVGKGALQFALERGMSLCRYEDILTEQRYRKWYITQSEHFTGELPYSPLEFATCPTCSGKQYKIPETAQEQPLAICPAQEVQEENHGTVGAVALDTLGLLAAATSTGGLPNKHPGRVGDSPLVGCGYYADDNAAISCTGHGENFVRLLLAKRAADFVARGATARDAAEASIALLNAKLGSHGGLIIVDRLGNVGFTWNATNMAHAYMTEDMQEPIAGL